MEEPIDVRVSLSEKVKTHGTALPTLRDGVKRRRKVHGMFPIKDSWLVCKPATRFERTHDRWPCVPQRSFHRIHFGDVALIFG